ncbi:aldolase/citrate lyase family protein [Siccirubricoccus sp. KC 17139]|uniref:Aldolase/citrate lyase family protein n=1 Tax=Siccirubricoccus soli TaxID=2899147 RepID=A0ABT1DCB4_9PROT|nr:aldolase/citrate lyase family protein [Siccirubricoccus soli]MCO6418855.1 aldolase/citrate lyase family protein [Siccirubricoccus soli]MCP2684990.1 aldolase/citrate lyase family protein [Siccirubricoccus soli]
MTTPGALFSNPVKEKLAAGGVALGLGVRMSRSAEIARIARATGHDFLFIDVQHSLFGLETIGHIAQAAIALGIAPLARVRSVGDQDVQALLDNGITGIVYPDVNTAEQARQAVAAVRFGPLGRRSVTGGYPYFDYRGVPPKEALPAIDAATLLVCMIETREGVANVEAIAATPGIDVIHIGMNDLLTNMGKPGQYQDPELQAAVDRVLAACRANKIAFGCGGNRDPKAQAAIIRRGAQFLTTQTDIGLLSAGANAWTSGIRAALDG